MRTDLGDSKFRYKAEDKAQAKTTEEEIEEDRKRTRAEYFKVYRTKSNAQKN